MLILVIQAYGFLQLLLSFHLYHATTRRRGGISVI